MVTDYTYWGCHTYNSETKTLNWSRNSGIFSNIMVIMHSLTDLWLKNMLPVSINTKLSDYNGFDLYDGVFQVNNAHLEIWKNMDSKRIDTMRFKTSPSIYGFGSSKDQIDLELTKTILDTYFNFSADVNNRIEQLKELHSIDTNDSVFIWWRKTDKIHEIARSKKDAKYPDISDVMSHVKPYKNIYMQTDDPVVYNEFLKIENVKCLDVFNRNKYFTDDNVYKNGFHIDSRDISDEQFNLKYGISRKDYIVNLICLASIASKCTQFVGYPGNISLYVSLLRNNFDNVVFFKNKEELF